MTYLTDALKAAATPLMTTAGQSVHLNYSSGGYNFWSYVGATGALGLPDYFPFLTVQRVAAMLSGNSYLVGQIFPPLSPADRQKAQVEISGWVQPAAFAITF